MKISVKTLCLLFSFVMNMVLMQGQKEMRKARDTFNLWEISMQSNELLHVSPHGKSSLSGHASARF